LEASIIPIDDDDDKGDDGSEDDDTLDYNAFD
jgi:hypothetical protein